MGSMLKVLVIGASGLFGSRFVKLYGNKYDLAVPSSSILDITDKVCVREYLSKEKLQLIINFAAVTDVSEAEKELGDTGGKTWRVNAEGVRNIVDAIDHARTFFIQISTDLACSEDFKDPKPFKETQLAESDKKRVTWYGYTKGFAEKIIKERLKRNYSIVRVVKISSSKFERKADYLHKFVILYDAGKLFPLFTDQYISLTFIDEACLALEKIIDNKLSGVFHVGSSDFVTPHKLVSYLLSRLRKEVNVRESTIESYIKGGGDPRRYPKYSALNTKDTQRGLGVKFSSWKSIVDKLIDQGFE